MADLHRYAARCAWRGSTGVGYEAYDRTHTVSSPPAEDELRLSADAAFRGDGARLNPEELLVMAASSCQLLAFLAVAAKARIDVVDYLDEAEAEMPASDDASATRITRMWLRPQITVASDTTEERVRHLVELAHRECYIANSLSTAVSVEPEIRLGGAASQPRGG